MPWEFWNKGVEKEFGGCTQRGRCRKAQHRWRGSACLPTTSAKDSSRNQGNLWIWKKYPSRGKQTWRFLHMQIWSVGDVPIGTPHPPHFLSPSQQSVLVRSSCHQKIKNINLFLHNYIIFFPNQLFLLPQYSYHKPQCQQLSQESAEVTVAKVHAKSSVLTLLWETAQWETLVSLVQGQWQQQVKILSQAHFTPDFTLHSSPEGNGH